MTRLSQYTQRQQSDIAPHQEKVILQMNALTQHSGHKGKTTGKQEHGDRDSIPPSPRCSPIFPFYRKNTDKPDHELRVPL